MSNLLTLSDAIRTHLNHGDCVAQEGFTSLVPFAAGHETIRQEKRDLMLVGMTQDVIFDQMIGLGCSKRLLFSWGGNSGVRSLHRLRDAVEKQLTHSMKIDERSHAAMTVSYAAAAGLPCGLMWAFSGSDLPHITSISGSLIAHSRLNDLLLPLRFGLISGKQSVLQVTKEG